MGASKVFYGPFRPRNFYRHDHDRFVVIARRRGFCLFGGQSYGQQY